jgi:Prokaryotic E2 family E
VPLLPADEAFLRTKGYTFELLAEGGSDQLVMLRGIQLFPGRFDLPATDVLVKLPPGYPATPLDMFWVFPALRYRAGGVPPSADTYESHEGKAWQRFSRHLPGGAWRPGIDSLRTFLPRFLAELTQP